MFKEIFSKEKGCAGNMNCDFTKIESNDGATKKTATHNFNFNAEKIRKTTTGNFLSIRKTASCNFPCFITYFNDYFSIQNGLILMSFQPVL